MELSHVTFQAPPVTDRSLLHGLPSELQGLLEQANGFVLHGGGLHVRGACASPEWHALGPVWTGTHALHRLYPAVDEADVPFGQDCVGDQLLLRKGMVHRLLSETGEVESLGLGLLAFLEAAEADPIEVLQMHPLLQHSRAGGKLDPGQLLDVYPPFCTSESAGGVSLRPVPALDRLRYLAALARQLRDLPDGARISFQTQP